MSVLARSALLFLVAAAPSSLGDCHNYTSDDAKDWAAFKDGSLDAFAREPGVMVSFENPIYTNGYFLGFDAWENVNKGYGAANVTYVVRIEFKRDGYRDNRVKRHYKRFWLPGAIHVERVPHSRHVVRANLTEAKVRNVSHVDLWVWPKCFLRHHGISRIHRVARSMKMGVDHIRWLAKVNYGKEEGYGPRELIEIAKEISKVTGVRCSWVHPPVPST